MEASFSSSTPWPESRAVVEMLLCRLPARHTQQDNFHLRGLQLCSHILAVTGFSTHACDLVTFLSHWWGLGGKSRHWERESAHPAQSARGVCAAELRKPGMMMALLERSSAEPEPGESPLVQLKMPLQLRVLLPPVRGWHHPYRWKGLMPSGTFTRCKDDNKSACFNQPSVCV